MRTYKGKANINGDYGWTSKSNVWRDTTVDMESHYRQTHENSNGWREESYVTCYMQRTSQDWSSSFPLKNNVPYNVFFGYNMYDQNYNLLSDDLMDSGWDKKTPVFSGTSGNFEVSWWDIEGASTLAATGVALAAVVAALNI